MMTNAPAYAKAPLGVAMAITVGPFVEVLGTSAISYGYANPDKVEIAVDVAIGAMDPNTPNNGWQGVGKGIEVINDSIFGK